MYAKLILVATKGRRHINMRQAQKSLNENI